MLAQSDLLSYLPVAVVASMAIVFVIANIVLSTILGPRAEGAIKGTTYEAGMIRSAPRGSASTCAST